MDRQLVDRLETFVKNEGFERIEITRSSTAQTLSAVKDQTRLVLHVSDGVAIPARAQAVLDTPASLIAVRPVAAGMTAAITGLPGTSGGAGPVAPVRPD